MGMGFQMAKRIRQVRSRRIWREENIFQSQRGSELLADLQNSSAGSGRIQPEFYQRDQRLEAIGKSNPGGFDEKRLLLVTTWDQLSSSVPASGYRFTLQLHRGKQRQQTWGILSAESRRIWPEFFQRYHQWSSAQQQIYFFLVFV